jgi:hypothetical protein
MRALNEAAALDALARDRIRSDVAEFTVTVLFGLFRQSMAMSVSIDAPPR